MTDAETNLNTILSAYYEWRKVLEGTRIGNGLWGAFGIAYAVSMLESMLGITRAAGSARSHFLDVRCSSARIKAPAALVT